MEDNMKVERIYERLRKALLEEPCTVSEANEAMEQLRESYSARRADKSYGKEMGMIHPGEIIDDRMERQIHEWTKTWIFDHMLAFQKQHMENLWKMANSHQSFCMVLRYDAEALNVYADYFTEGVENGSECILPAAEGMQDPLLR